MDIFDILTMVGGLCLFLFGMNIMGESLERRTGGTLRTLLRKLTTKKFAGFLTGLGVTAVIQSSSATTVMVVGFVNSGLINLTQAINVIMGANVGTTITAWILSLGGIEGGNLFTNLLKPTSFTPVLALIGIIFYMFLKGERKKDTGTILLGFTTLMVGMDTMSEAVKGLRDVPEFRQMFLLFENPIMGVFAGAVLTGIIQSSSASVGILQALSATGAVSVGTSIPIIMGQNIGTCVTALISSVGTNKNAKRASLVHLLFNTIGTVVSLAIFIIVSRLARLPFLENEANRLTISICHTAFNLFSTVLLIPMSGMFEKLVCKILPDDKKTEENAELDERLLTTPSIALEQCRNITVELARCAEEAIKGGIECLTVYDSRLGEKVRKFEERTDHYEDILSSYLIKLSTQAVNASDSAETAGLLKIIGDYERIADHAVNLVEAAEEIQEKERVFTEKAVNELKVLCAAVKEVVSLAGVAFTKNNIEAAENVEPLEEVVDGLKEELRTRHIERLRKGVCSIDAGFVLSDILTDLERVSDHCSNIAVCVIDVSREKMNPHEAVRNMRAGGNEFDSAYNAYRTKFHLAG